MEKPPFFIVGVGRSGTTLIRLMINNHPNIAIPYESHFITKYYEKLNSYGDLSDKNNLRKIVSDILAEEILTKWDHTFKLENIVDGVKESTIKGVFDSLYKDYAKSKGKIRWGDKSDYLDRMYLINKIFPEAQFIHIVRDGRDVASSVMKLSWGPNDIIAAAEWWNSYVNLARCMGAIIGDDRYMEVRYEDLVQDSENELKRICSFLGEEFSAEMLNYHKSSKSSIPSELNCLHYNTDKPPTASRAYAWKREMSPTDIFLFDSYAKNMLKALGYEVPTIAVSSIYAKLAKFKIFVKRMLS